MVQAMSSTGTRRSKPWEYVWIGEFSQFHVLCLISDFSHILSLSISLSIFISSHLSKKGQVPAFPGLLLHSFSHHTATSFPAQRPLGNDLLKLERCLFILWSPLTSNAELQPSPIYQPPRPPAALTL
ncbi:uncharacterized protein N7525_000179 [Penicillium rubens]|uniref:uncharacterized protein n=1 Tax=Penicillium rubens TaxID=1108849 RepID=UPI002A5A2465|nr:uncharacterized protein N7525_000179 [Penicillium rubens]KAJ5842438.1 hypothetical protein N7525_000179 [Penicillium rubens]